MKSENSSSKIAATSFAFANGCVYCVGNIIAIQDIVNYYNLRDGQIIIDNFVDRIIYDKIYCHITTSSIREKIKVIRLNSMLKKVKLDMDYDAYLEALCIVQPDKLSGILSANDIEKIKNDNCWNGVFP